jgi:hypothetical protein
MDANVTSQVEERDEREWELTDEDLDRARTSPGFSGTYCHGGP